jgi:hypothetical protein
MAVILSGPFFDGRADRAVVVMCERIRHHVADIALQRLYIRFGQVLRNPTPYYTTRLRTTRLATEDRVHDRRMVYGPWLEGTGSRNKTTRFKGYRTFRIVTARLQIDSDELAEPIVRAHMDRMNF